MMAGSRSRDGGRTSAATLMKFTQQKTQIEPALSEIEAVVAVVALVCVGFNRLRHLPLQMHGDR